MNGSELRHLFQTIVMEAFCVDHEAYLRDENKSFVGLGIDQDNNCFTSLFGNPCPALLNASFFVSKAGYSVGAPDKPHGIGADVLLFATSLLTESADASLRRALLLHEACHLIVDANLLRLKATPSDKSLVQKFCGRLHPDDRFHNKDFMRQLSVAARMIDGEEGAFSLMNIAIRFDAFPEDCDDPE